MNAPRRGRASGPEPRWKKGVVGRVVRFATHDAWHVELGGVPTFHRLWMRAYRIVHIAVRGFFKDGCSREAAVLTYITIFSLPALLMMVFALAKGFGAYSTLQNDVINPFLDRTFGARALPGEETGKPGQNEAEEEGDREPATTDQGTEAGAENGSGETDSLPEQGAEEPAKEPEESEAEGEDGGASGKSPGASASPDEGAGDDPEMGVDPTSQEAPPNGEGVEQIRQIIDQIFAAVEKVDFRALTSIGFLLLIYSALKMLAAVERALNGIWGIRRPRSLVRRLTDYLSIVVVAPVLLILGSALTVYLKSEKFAATVGDVGVVFRPVVAMLPVVSVWLGLTFVLLTMPNKRVRLSSAVLGGIVAGLGWQFVQYAHVEFQIGIARMQPIYSSFVAMPLFLIWIYLSWNAFLAGAQVACAHENESLYTSIARTGEVDQAYREALAPRLVGRITAAFLAGEPAPDALHLASELCIAPRTATEVLETLQAHDLLVQTHEDQGEGYLPGRDPDTIRVLDLLQALRLDHGSGNPPVRGPLDARVDRILDSFAETLRASEPNSTMRELGRAYLDGREEPGPDRDPTPGSEDAPLGD